MKDLKGVTEFFAAYFEEKGYQISCEETAGGTSISMTKGGLFRAISGLKTGLNITLAQLPESVNVKMEIGIFGKQWLPGTIATFLFWPVLVTQMIGLIQQNKLDQEAYQVLEKGIQF